MRLRQLMKTVRSARLVYHKRHLSRVPSASTCHGEQLFLLFSSIPSTMCEGLAKTCTTGLDLHQIGNDRRAVNVISNIESRSTFGSRRTMLSAFNGGQKT